MTRSYFLVILLVIILTIVLILTLDNNSNNSNIYITGSYKKEAFFRDKGNNSRIGATLPSTSESNDSFLTKYNSEGIVSWAARQGGTCFDQGNGVATDSANNIYITGNYEFGCSFYSQNDDNPVVTLPNSGSSDNFLAKYSKEGIVSWAARQEGTGNDFGFGVTNDSADNIYITGSYSNGCSFYSQNDDNPIVTLPNSGGTNGFLAKYSKEGIVSWAARQEGTGSDQSLAVATDNNDNIYITGLYANGCSFYSQNDDNPIVTLLNSSARNSFLAKYNSNGNVKWAARQGGIGIDQGNGVTTDNNDNIYITGYYLNGCSFYSQNDDNPVVTLPNSGVYTSFLAKYSKEGIVSWAARQGGIGGNNGIKVASDSADNIYITGTYEFGCSFYSQNDDNPVVTFPNSGSRDNFLAKYSKEGIVSWAARQVGTGTDRGYGVATDSADNIYITGQYASSGLSFYSQNDNNEPAFTLLSTGSSDDNVFTAKYSSEGKFLWAAVAGPSVSGGNNSGNGIAVSN